VARGILGVVIGALMGSCVASAQDRAQIEAGEALYDEHCANCHGEIETGMIPSPPPGATFNGAL